MMRIFRQPAGCRSPVTGYEKGNGPQPAAQLITEMTS
jgi:hypothetical protein